MASKNPVPLYKCCEAYSGRWPAYVDGFGRKVLRNGEG